MFSFSTNNYSLISNTWNKDAHGLFDYESDSINKNTFSIEKGGKLNRNEKNNSTDFIPDKNDNSFFLTGSQSSSTTNNDCLAYFYNEYGNKIKLSKNINNSYEYNKKNIIIIQEKMYKLINQTELKSIKKEYLCNYKYKPKKNDIIRFGRVQFIVRNLKDKSTILSENNNNNDLINNNNNNNNNNIYLPNNNDEIKISNNNKCKLCNKSEDNSQNPLLKICPCSKSYYFHYKCFKKYIKENTEDYNYTENDYTNEKTLKIITIYNFLCPFCDEPYNPIVIKNKKEFNILPYEILKKDSFHIVLESINLLKENIFTVMIILFYFPKLKEEYFLGRGHEATFKISDISISRVHSKFYVDSKENIVIEDLGSKFGSLHLFREDCDLDEICEKKIKVQIGRTVFWIEKE